jgi:hypothetical protein
VTEMLDATIDWLGAYMVFGMIVLGLAGSAMLLTLFAGLAVRGAWRWLRRHTWRDVVLFSERKALR